MPLLGTTLAFQSRRERHRHGESSNSPAALEDAELLDTPASEVPRMGGLLITTRRNGAPFLITLTLCGRPVVLRGTISVTHRGLHVRSGPMSADRHARQAERVSYACHTNRSCYLGRLAAKRRQLTSCLAVNLRLLPKRLAKGKDHKSCKPN